MVNSRPKTVLQGYSSQRRQKAVKIQKISTNSFSSLNIRVYEERRRIVIVKDSKQDINHSGLVISLLIYIRYKIVRVRKKTKQPTLT